MIIIALKFIFNFFVATLLIMAINVFFMAGAYSGFILPVAFVAAIVYTKATWEPDFDYDEDENEKA